MFVLMFAFGLGSMLGSRFGIILVVMVGLQCMHSTRARPWFAASHVSQLWLELGVSTTVANFNLLLPILHPNPLQFNSLTITQGWVNLEVSMPFLAFALTYEHVVGNGILLLRALVKIDVDEVVIFALILDLAFCSPCTSRTKASCFFLVYRGTQRRWLWVM